MMSGATEKVMDKMIKYGAVFAEVGSTVRDGRDVETL